MENPKAAEAPTCAFQVPKARQLLGNISHSHFYHLAKTGRLKLTKLGRRTVVTDAAIRQCLTDMGVAS